MKEILLSFLIYIQETETQELNKIPRSLQVISANTGLWTGAAWHQLCTASTLCPLRAKGQLWVLSQKPIMIHGVSGGPSLQLLRHVKKAGAWRVRETKFFWLSLSSLPSVLTFRDGKHLFGD